MRPHTWISAVNQMCKSCICRTKKISPYWLLSVSVLFVLLMAFTKPIFFYSHIDWTPKTASDAGDFVLVRGWPKELKIRTSCDALSQATDGNILDLGGLVLSKVDNTISFQPTQNAGYTLTKGVSPSNCIVLASFDSDNSTIELSVNGKSLRKILPRNAFPRITQLIIPETQRPVIEQVDIKTQPTGIKSQAARYVFGLVAAFVLFLLALRMRRPPSPQNSFQWLPQLHTSDGFVCLGLITVSLFSPTLMDDGWVWQRLQAFEGRNVFGDYFANSDAWMPQGFLNEYIYRRLQDFGLNFLALRGFVVLVLIATWISIRSRVLSRIQVVSGSTLIVVGSCWIAFSGAWLITLRAEPIVCLLATLSLIGFLTGSQDGNPSGTLRCFFFAGLAVVTHQSGLVALASPALLLIWTAKTNKRAFRTNGFWLPLLISILGVTLCALIPMDLRTLLDNFKVFASNPSYQSGPFGEPVRYLTLLTTTLETGALRIFSVLFLIVLLAISGLVASLERWGLRLAITFSLLSLFFLAFTSSKWIWHFGVLALPTCLLLGSFVEAILRKKDLLQNRLALSAFGLVLVLTVGTSLSYPNSWGMHLPAGETWEAFSRSFGGTAHPQPWIFISVVVFLAAVFLVKRDSIFLSWVISAVVLTPLVLSIHQVSFSSRVARQNSQLARNWASIAGTNECGSIDSLSHFVPAGELSIREETPSPQVDSGLPLKAMGFPEQWLQLPMATDIPLRTWGTWTFSSSSATSLESQESEKDLFMGNAFSPLFRVPNHQDVALYSIAGSEGSVTGFIEYLSKDKARISLQTLNFPTVLNWYQNLLDIPISATYLRVWIKDQSTTPGGWGAITSPASGTLTSISELLRDATSFTNPFVLLKYPCLKLPSPNLGFWPQVSYLVDDLVDDSNVAWSAFPFTGDPNSLIQWKECDLDRYVCIAKIKTQPAKVSVLQISS